MSIKKSEILNRFANNYPNFLKRDLTKLIDIFILEVKNSLKRRERVEIRDFFHLSQNYKKQELGETLVLMKKFMLKKNIILNLKPQNYGQKK